MTQFGSARLVSEMRCDAVRSPDGRPFAVGIRVAFALEPLSLRSHCPCRRATRSPSPSASLDTRRAQCTVGVRRSHRASSSASLRLARAPHSSFFLSFSLDSIPVRLLNVSSRLSLHSISLQPFCLFLILFLVVDAETRRDATDLRRITARHVPVLLSPLHSSPSQPRDSPFGMHIGAKSRCRAI